jgi:polar amino acid transport system substrate-binding protein
MSDAEKVRRSTQREIPMFRSFAAAVTTLLMAACTTPPVVPDAARSQLAPTGKLRAGMNLDNTLFTTKDAATGELRGVSVDLMRELASRLGVPLDLVVHASPGDVADAADKGTWDVAILAIEQSRAQKIAFSPPKAGYELYLTRTLRNATLIRAPGFPGSAKVFNERRADALAALKPALLSSMETIADARMLEGKFMTVNHGLGTPRERGAAAAYLKAFVEDMNASGFVARSIERHGVQGLLAAR